MANDLARAEPGAVISAPEIRDYDEINAELIRLLNLGKQWIRVEGVSGQRLLAAQLSGSWNAVIEIVGRAGPELAAQTHAPSLIILCRGPVADGAASGLRAGRVLVEGDAGAAFGYHLKGGLALVTGAAGPRAGLGQEGGDIVLLGPAGPLTGERQSGGRLFLACERVGPHLGLARRGGRLIVLFAGEGGAEDVPVLYSIRDNLLPFFGIHNSSLDLF